MRDDGVARSLFPTEKVGHPPSVGISKQALCFTSWRVPLNFVVLTLVTAFSPHSPDIVAIGFPKSLAEEAIRRDPTEAAQHLRRGLVLYDQ